MHKYPSEWSLKYFGSVSGTPEWIAEFTTWRLLVISCLFYLHVNYEITGITYAQQINQWGRVACTRSLKTVGLYCWSRRLSPLNLSSTHGKCALQLESHSATSWMKVDVTMNALGEETFNLIDRKLTSPWTTFRSPVQVDNLMEYVPERFGNLKVSHLSRICAIHLFIYLLANLFIQYSAGS